MNVKNEFSKHANEYGNYNIIQQIIAKALVRDIDGDPKKILELGCGSGQIFNHVNWDVDHYKAIDFSAQMCALHPKGPNVEVACMSFDSSEFRDSLQQQYYDVVLSASALQWSKDLPLVIESLTSCTKEINAVLFSSGTFKSIQNITQKPSPILDIDTIKHAFEQYCDCSFEVFTYDLKFDSKKELFAYIKNSGVSSSNSTLCFKEAKHLYKSYDLDYLEFEVIFVKAFSKSYSS